MRLWDVDAAKVLNEFKGPTQLIWAMAMSPDGKDGLTGGDNRDGHLWRLAER